MKFVFKIFRRLCWTYNQKKIRVLLNNKTISVFGSPDITFENKIKIGENCSINHQAYLNGMGGIVIGNNVSISAGVKMISTGLDVNVIEKKHVNKEIVIEDNVWIGAGAIILSGVTIKKNSVIAAGAVVNKDIGEGEIWVGVPAKLLRKRCIG